jgi:hypothetical protein
MAGKGGKGLQATKTTAAKSTDKDKDKKKAPVSRSFRAGLQVPSCFLFLLFSPVHHFLVLRCSRKLQIWAFFL